MDAISPSRTDATSKEDGFKTNPRIILPDNQIAVPAMIGELKRVVGTMLTDARSQRFYPENVSRAKVTATTNGVKISGTVDTSLLKAKLAGVFGDNANKFTFG